MEQVTLLVQTLLVAAQTAWLVLGATENMRAPAANGGLVADVIRMQQMREVYPDLYAVLGRNRVENARFHKLAFAAIVVAEAIVSLVMIVGTLALGAATLGIVPVAVALPIAVLGVLGFTLIWSGFLVGGQWFHYWAGHEGAQQTHFVLTIWGTAVLVLLLVA